MSLPKINGLFRLTRDCEMVQAGETTIAKLGLAASEKYKDKETKLFIDAVAFGKIGEIIGQYAGSKGTQIYLNGKIQLDQWQDKTSGENRSKTSMVIEGFDFVSGQGVQQNPNTGQPSGQGQQQQQAQQPQPYQQNYQQQGQQPQQGQQQVGGNQGRPQRPQQAPNDFDNSHVPF